MPEEELDEVINWFYPSKRLKRPKIEIRNKHFKCKKAWSTHLIVGHICDKQTTI